MAHTKDIPLTIEVGEYMQFRANILDASNAVITNLVGYKAYVRYGLQPKDNNASVVAIVEFTTEGLQPTILIDTGNFVWVMTPELSRALKEGIWQMWVTNLEGKSIRVYEGQITLSPEIRAKYVT